MNAIIRYFILAALLLGVGTTTTLAFCPTTLTRSTTTLMAAKKPQTTPPPQQEEQDEGFSLAKTVEGLSKIFNRPRYDWVNNKVMDPDKDPMFKARTRWNVKKPE